MPTRKLLMHWHHIAIQLGLGHESKWPRPRRLPPETETLTIFLETRPSTRPSWDRDVETETTTLLTDVFFPVQTLRTFDGVASCLRSTRSTWIRCLSLLPALKLHLVSETVVDLRTALYRSTIIPPGMYRIVAEIVCRSLMMALTTSEAYS